MRSFEQQLHPDTGSRRHDLESIPPRDLTVEELRIMLDSTREALVRRAENDSNMHDIRKALEAWKPYQLELERRLKELLLEHSHDPAMRSPRSLR